MSTAEPRRLTLDVIRVDPLEGRLHGDDGHVRPFLGWMDLARGLEELLSRQPSISPIITDPREDHRRDLERSMMTDQQSKMTGGQSRRSRRFLPPSEKYEIWISLLRGEYTIAAAAGQSGVDR